MTKSSTALKFFTTCLAACIIFFVTFVRISGNSAEIFSVVLGQKEVNSALLLLPLSRCRYYESVTDINQISASDNDSSIILSYKNGKIVSLNITDFQLMWSLDLGLNISSNMVFDEESLFIIVENKNKEGYLLKKINKTIGLPEWQAEINITENLSKEKTGSIYLEIIKDKLIVISRSGNILCFDKQSKELTWARNFGNNFTSLPFLAGDDVFVSTNSKIITKISAASGTTVTEIMTATVPVVLSALPDGTIVYGDKNGNVYSLNETSKQINWKIQFGAEIASIVQTRFGLLISSFDNFAYLIQNQNGKRLWKKRMAERVLQKPLVLDNYVIMTNSFQSEAVIINLRTGKIVNRVNLHKENFFTGDVIFTNKSLVFSSLKGLVSFSSVSENCGKNVVASNK